MTAMVFIDPDYRTGRALQTAGVQCERVRRSALTLLLLSLVTFFLGLGRQAITDSDEAFYAEAASISRFLVGKSDRATFLAFVNKGMRDGWDKAVKEHYRYRNVDELEVAWLQQVKQAREKAADSRRAEMK